MRDAGLPSRHERAKGAKMLAKTVQDRMAQWTDDQFGNFEESMELIRVGAPVQWVKLYMEAVKLGIVKESNINITVSRQQDRENLQALVRTRIPASLPQQVAVPDASPSGSTVYTPFVEIPAKKEQL
ncbi:MAG: hypothetical protein IJ059_05115 [Prevotella sp.]|nr:hypothetical protein [Prevotella sp.]